MHSSQRFSFLRVLRDASVINVGFAIPKNLLQSVDTNVLFLLLLCSFKLSDFYKSLHKLLIFSSLFYFFRNG